MGGSSAECLSCKVLSDWSIINLRERNHIDENIFKEEKTLPFCVVFFFNEIFLTCRVPEFRDQNMVKHGGPGYLILVY